MTISTNDSNQGTLKNEDLTTGDHKTTGPSIIDLQMFAHDVRRPLSLVHSLIKILDHVPDEELRSTIRRYEEEIKQAGRMVNAMLEEILTAKDMKILNLAPVSVENLFSQSIKEVLAEHPESKVGFQLNFLGSQRVFVDRFQVVRVVSNILANALEAMNHNGLVLISSQVKGEMLEVTITNTGSKIDEEVLPRIFDLHFTNKKHGVGLGLPIAKRIVENHGGEISCQSLHDKTEFSFTLPLSP